MSLVDWRTPMEYATEQHEEINLTHDLGEGMIVKYSHDGKINTCGAWVTASGQNAIREVSNAKGWFAWAKTSTPLVVLESAIEEQYWVDGYSTVKHSRLLRAAGRAAEAKELIAQRCR